jgi:hypothetical protein
MTRRNAKGIAAAQMYAWEPEMDDSSLGVQQFIQQLIRECLSSFQNDFGAHLARLDREKQCRCAIDHSIAR